MADKDIAGFVVVVLENTNKDVTMGNEYFLNLTHYGMVLGGYHGRSTLTFNGVKYMLTFAALGS